MKTFHSAPPAPNRCDIKFEGGFKARGSHRIGFAGRGGREGGVRGVGGLGRRVWASGVQHTRSVCFGGGTTCDYI